MALLDEFAEVNANSPEGDQRNKRDKAIKDWRHDFSNGASYLAYQSFAKALQGRPPLADYRNCPHFQVVLSTLSHIYDSKEVKEEIVRYIELIFDLVNRLTMKYEDYKKEHHAVDYVDIENHFLTLLDNEEVTAEAVNKIKTIFGITGEELKYEAQSDNAIIGNATSYSDADVKLAESIKSIQDNTVYDCGEF